MDRIEGTVTITPKCDTRFDDIDITFEGIERTSIERMAASAATLSPIIDVSHRFLKMDQPIDERFLPHPRIAEAGRTYSFPFTFIVPSQLLPRACAHRASVPDHVKAAHLQVPPSIGEQTVSSIGNSFIDDMAPEMAKIIYAIKIKVSRTRERDGVVEVLAEKSQKVQIRPAREEEPPLNVDGKSDEYRLREEKTVRKGMLKGKAGRLSAETLQPHSLSATPVDRSQSSTNTTARILLRFDPIDSQSLPPRLGSLSTKLKVNTWYASHPRNDFPRKSQLLLDMTQGLYSESIALSSRCVASAQWQRHESDRLARRDSGISDCSDNFASGIASPSSIYSGKVFYTAELIVPIALPTNKNFIPTFHTCLISRTYSLGLSLSVHGGPSISLKVPIQLSAEGSTNSIASRRASEAAAVVANDVDAIFQPRIITPHTSVISEMPPGYQPIATPLRVRG